MHDEGSSEAKPHRHKHWEMAYALNGRGVYHIDQEAFDMSRGDLVLIEPGVFHCEQSDGASSLEILFLMFAPGFSPREALGLDFPASVILPAGDNPEIERILRSILQEVTVQSQGFDRFITAEIMRLFLSVFRLATHSPVVAPTPKTLPGAARRRNEKMVEEIRQVMEASIGSHLNIGDIASRFYISPQHLIRVFREVTGKTPKEYVTERKIIRALDLLQKQTEVAVIADTLGYSSISHFYRAFKKETGRTPRQHGLNMG